MQAAFHEHYAAQCGFCTSGFMMAAQALVERGDGDRARGGDRGAQRPRVPLHRLREDRRRGHGRRPRRRVAGAPSADTDPQGEDAVTLIPGARHEGRRRPPAPLRRRRPRHGPHAVRRRRPRPRHAVVQGAALAPPQRAHPLDRHEQGARRMPGVHAIVTARGRAPQRLRAPRGRSASRPTSRCWPTTTCAGRARSSRAVAAESEEIAQAAVDAIEIELRGARAGPRHPHRRRPRRGRALPPVGRRSIRTSARTTTAACARATSRPPSTRPT